MGRKGLVKVVGIRPAFLASISNWQEHLEPRLFNCGEELVLAVAQNASAQATVFEAEVKDKLEEAKETVSLSGC